MLRAMTEPLVRAWSGHRVLVYPELASTSSHARDGVEAGALGAGDAVLADVQTAGRGRRGRRWFAPAGRALTLSVVLRPPPGPRPGTAAILAAVATTRAVEAGGCGTLAIKWPNDLMRAGRKVGGLLIESAVRPDGEPLLVVGIGLNLDLRPGDLPPDVAARAGGIGLGSEHRDALCRALLAELGSAFAASANGDDGAWRSEYCRRSWLDGRHATLRAAGVPWSGRIARVTGEGDLLLEDGRLLRGETVELESVREP